MFAIMLAAAAVGQPNLVAGRWQTETRHGVVEVTPCGASICGRLIDSDSIRADPQARDGHNRDSAQRQRALKGMMMLQGFHPAASGWDVGSVYNDADGGTYHGTITVIDARTLKVGAPLPLDVRTSFEQRTGVRVCEGYGLTEASPIVACNPVFGLIKENSCGPRFPATMIEIRDPDDPTHLMPTGARGEVCVRGPQVMAGYWQRPEETAATFVDGALRTGDIGYLDEDGYLFLVDRIKDLILCGGYNVYPRLIEEAAYRHPAIEEAIAIAIPDPYRGQSPKLFVRLRDGHHTEPQDIIDFLSTFLNKVELPKLVEIRDSLPKTLIGKLSKKALIEEERLKEVRV